MMNNITVRVKECDKRVNYPQSSLIIWKNSCKFPCRFEAVQPTSNLNKE